MSDLMNKLISHEAVYRTAPATPGLLKTCSKQDDHIHPILLLKNFTDKDRRVDNNIGFSYQAIRRKASITVQNKKNSV